MQVADGAAGSMGIGGLLGRQRIGRMAANKGSARPRMASGCAVIGLLCAVLDVSIGGHRAQGTDAGDGPARRLGSDAIRERRHDVSIRISGMAGGWYLGFEPRAKTSMTIMRPPQQGHGRA